MQYIELRQALQSFTVFTLTDIRMLDTSFHRRRLNEWQDKGYIIKLIKGYYIFSDLELNENVLFEIANRLYRPSYISLETALAYHSLIPESVYGITSISTRRTYKFKTPIAEFSFRTISPNLFFGYEIIAHNDKAFKMALVEKALLDYFYLHPEIKKREDFVSLRINKDVLFRKTNKKRCDVLVKKFDKRALAMRMQVFWEVMNHA